MELTVYRPFRAMRPTRDFPSHFFGSRLFDLMNEEGSSEFERFYPSVDISETDKDIKLKAELPGIDKGDVKLEVRDGLLIIKGEKKTENKVEKKGYYRKESHYGSFERSFRLPEYADSEKTQAELKKGVLDITIPKIEEGESKKIEIQAE
ncbi:MAG: Hsp20/alpha crystallin family protein [Thermodesulfobacteriota bacterium]|nr:Hsp20/alpha crystallin family protein [Thermodesulfobacteriota bacterium]